ncbi:MAG: phosphotransferase [Anaerolineae bacterium]|nr:phosphotransferase [Anaerolineae bacterium]
MEPIIRNRYNDEILAEARQRYGIDEDKIQLLDGFESFMFAYKKNDADYILRLSHSRRRTPDMIRGEVDWINYLAAGGAGVAKAVLSDNGALVELIDDGEGDQFLATAFVKAKGAPVRKGFWDEPFFENYGRLLGRIHRLSKSYTLANPSWHRGSWNDAANLSIREYLENDGTLVGERNEALIAYLEALPQDPDSFGMIHQDAHAGNFFVDDDGQITLFDFDDCLYGHFVYDLAMVLFYAVTNREDADEFAPVFWEPFWRGYCEENELDSSWLKEIPHFMKLREIDLYAVLMRDYSPETWGADSWPGRYMNGRLQRIEQGIPYISMTF